MKRERDIISPENLEPDLNLQELVPGVRGYKLTRKNLFGIVNLTALIVASASSCVEPTISPNAKTPDIFTPTETPTPTEIPQAEYSATVLDFTSFVENNPDSITQDYKDLHTASFDLAKEMEEFRRFTPNIWTIAINDDGPKKDENLIFAQNKTTNEFYLLIINSTSNNESKSTLIKEKIFTEIVMGEGGQPQKIRYYYKEEDGSQTEFLRYDPENKINNSNYFYTTIDGDKIPLDEIPVYVGKLENSNGGKLLSLVPPSEDFYKTLPAGSIVNTETGLITDTSGETLYHLDGKWIKQPVLESGEALEFSPLLPAVWSKEWTGKAEGMDIPIIIGLSEGVYNDKKTPITPIKEVWITQEGTDAVADAFLRITYNRWSKIMGNPETYEEWLDIIKNQPHGGEVNLLITDNELDENGNAVRREALIDPRQGFSLLITDEIDRKIGVQSNRMMDSIFFYGVDGQGRLLVSSSFFSRFFSKSNNEVIVKGVQITGYSFIWFELFTISHLGYIENRCMINGSIYSTCGEQRTPPEINDCWQKLLALDKIQAQNGKFDLWGIVR